MAPDATEDDHFSDAQSDHLEEAFGSDLSMFRTAAAPDEGEEDFLDAEEGEEAVAGTSKAQAETGRTVETPSSDEDFECGDQELSGAPSQYGSHPASAAEHDGDQLLTPSPPAVDPNEPLPDSQEYKDLMARAEENKRLGNDAYKAGNTEEALELYAAALSCAPTTAKERAVYHSNRAACYMHTRDWTPACKECSAALDVDDTYLKARLRRMAAFEALDELERALGDAEKALAQDPGCRPAAACKAKVGPVVEERREKMKEEMMGKLKDLGNTVLGKFGMSLDNFKSVQDPKTGGYSIQFSQ